LQLSPTTFFEDDIFELVMVGLQTFPKDTVESLFQKTFTEILSLLPNEGSPHLIHLIVDKAQTAASTLSDAFVSCTELNMLQPILRELLTAWCNVSFTNMLRVIVSGTGIRLDAITKAVASGSAKVEPIGTYHNTGSFDKQQEQEAYVMQYLWPGKTKDMLTSADLSLLSQIWRWLCGRFVFHRTEIASSI
jgi:hypothetical protein